MSENSKFDKTIKTLARDEQSHAKIVKQNSGGSWHPPPATTRPSLKGCLTLVKENWPSSGGDQETQLPPSDDPLLYFLCVG